MDVAFNRERKTWGLRASPGKPQQGYPLAGVARIIDEHGLGVFEIKFNFAFVQALGKVMPQGVGPENQAYLYVVEEKIGTVRWSIHAQYVDSITSVLLWRQFEKPAWIGRIRRTNGGKKKTAAQGRGGVSRRDSKTQKASEG